MNNLLRELAPISDAAWAEIEEEASRTLKRYLAARRIVDVVGPKGTAYAAAGTGHTRPIEAPGAGIRSLLREAQPLVELRVPFTLTRQAIDDVERGSEDSDWQPVKITHGKGSHSLRLGEEEDAHCQRGDRQGCADLEIGPEIDVDAVLGCALGNDEIGDRA